MIYFYHMKLNFSSRNKAFTLIELLVVIAIIGILASVVIASLNSARAKARDAKRVSDLKQIQTALTMYYADNGAYPSTSGQIRGVCSGYGGHAVSGATGYIPNLAPTYIPVLPVDPKPTGAAADCIIYNSGGASEYVIANLRSYEGVVPDALKRISIPTEKTIAIYTPGYANF